MQGFVRLKVIFTGHPPQRAFKSQGLADIKKQNNITPICHNALRMAQEFQRRCHGSEFKVQKPEMETIKDVNGDFLELTNRVVTEVFIPKPGMTSAYEWFDELGRKVGEFEDQIGARHKTRVYLDDMVF